MALSLTACTRTEPDRRPLQEPPGEELVPQPTGSCVIDGRGGVCTAGGCTLVVPQRGLAAPTAVEIRRVPVPERLRDEVFGDIACEVGPAGLAFDGLARLTLEVESVPAGFEREDAVAVFIEGGSLILAPDTQVQPGGLGVALSIDGASYVALTFLAARIRFQGEISAGRGSVDEPVDLLRNLSSRPFVAAHHDGRRLYLGHGDRVLVYEDGVPENPLALPDLVLGARDLVEPAEAPSAASFGSTVNGIWSNGTRLAISTGNRVLLWNDAPRETFAPADLVLGQRNFTDNLPNRGRVTPGPDTLAGPNQMAGDRQRFFLADSNNHRVLVWLSPPTFVGQPADLVVGQTDFDTREPSSGAIPMFQSRGVLFDGARTLLTSTFGGNCVFALLGLPERSNPAPDRCFGRAPATTRVGPLDLAQPGALGLYGAMGLAARDFVGRRVSIWPETPTRDDEAPRFVIGRPDAFVGGADIGGIRASSLAYENVFASLHVDASRLVVPEGRRVLVFEPLPTYTFAPANVVIGQGSFSTLEPAADYGELDGDSLARPAGIAVSSDGIWAIADTGNDRVLLVRDGRGVVALGQRNLQEFGPNRFGARPSASTLSGPEGVLFVGAALYVADGGNHRVLVWDSIPQISGAPADRVLGQDSFDEGRPNRGLTDRDADGFVDADERGLFYPTGLAEVGPRLYVADTLNHRVLGFDLPLPERAVAVVAIGQPGLRQNRPNRGAGFLIPAERGLAMPSGLAVDARGALYVADAENNRVLRYDDPNQNDPTPSAFLGQDDLRSQRAPSFTPDAPGVPLQENRLLVTAATLRRPTALLVRGNRLYVADTGNHRVLGFGLNDLGPDASPQRILGQSASSRRDPNAFGPDGRSLFGPFGLAAAQDRLLVTDRENHRVLEHALPLASAADAVGVFGQPNTLETGFNRGVGSRRSVSDPVGVVRAGGRLWVSDRARNRVLVFEGDQPVIVLGQVDLTRVLRNGGGVPSERTLSGPTGLATDGRRLVVADTENHRVLIFERLPTESAAPADVVIGQIDFSRAPPNRGLPLTAPDASSLRAPQGVALDGERLLIADTGNNRVLIFEPVPGVNGASATDVICQPDFSTNLPNLGRAGASPAGCYGPVSAVVTGGQIAVGDTFNDRVVVFDAEGRPGRAARAVIGQPDFETRGGSPPGEDTLDGPTTLAVDGANLLVGDAGHNRILVFQANPVESGRRARQVVGQPSFETEAPGDGPLGLSAPSGMFVERISFIESRVWVADTGNGRVVELNGVRR